MADMRSKEKDLGAPVGDESVGAFVVKEKEERPVAKKEPERLIYVGPNIPGGVLWTGQVFKGGYPPHLAELFERHPEVKELFVPVATLSEVQKKIRTAGSNEWRLFETVRREVR